MNLFEQISEDIKKAMLARNKVELEALRGIKKELLEAKTSKENAGELTDAVAIKVIQKMAKQGKDTAEVFAQQPFITSYLKNFNVTEINLKKYLHNSQKSITFAPNLSQTHRT